MRLSGLRGGDLPPQHAGPAPGSRFVMPHEGEAAQASVFAAPAGSSRGVRGVLRAGRGRVADGAAADPGGIPGGLTAGLQVLDVGGDRPGRGRGRGRGGGQDGPAGPRKIPLLPSEGGRMVLPAREKREAKSGNQGGGRDRRRGGGGRSDLDKILEQVAACDFGECMDEAEAAKCVLG